MLIPIALNNKMKNKLLKLLKEKQGAALIYALCVMAVFTFICFALLFLTAQVGTVTMADRRREIYYQQALAMSDVIETELSEAGSQSQTPETLKAKIDDYLPQVNQPSDFEEYLPLSFVAEANGEHPSMSIRLQNGEYTMPGNKDNTFWVPDAVAYQCVDITVSVYDSTGVKAAVTTRYACKQEIGEMVYNIFIKDKEGNIKDKYLDLDEPGNDNSGFLDKSGNTIPWDVTLGDARKWMGAEQQIGDIKLQITRTRDPEKEATGGTYYEKVERR